VVSKPRLDSYRGYWKVSAAEAVGLYIWNSEVCSEISKLLSFLEINLRNNIHREISLSTTHGASGSSHWWDVSSRQSAVENFHEFKEIRNRVAHHEPLWKFPAIMDTSPLPPELPRLICAASTDEASTLSRFNRLLDLYDLAVTSLSPDFHAHIKKSSWRKKLDFLLSYRGLDRYKTGSHVANDACISTEELSQRFEAIVQDNRPVQLLETTGSGLFTPDKAQSRVASLCN
jgi:hypothetical protein